MKKIAGVWVAALAVILLASGDSDQAHAGLPLVPHYKCYDVQTEPISIPPVELVTQFGVEQAVPVGAPTRMCLSATKNGEGDLLQQDVECFAIAGPASNRTVNLVTQFGTQQNVSVGSPQELCMPASKAVLPQQPQGPPPPVPHYECFDITGNPPLVSPVDLVTQLSEELDVVVGPPTRLCLPAIKNGEGDLNAPHLECFAIGGPTLGVGLSLITQFGLQQPVLLTSPSELCVPAIKEVVPSTPTPTPTVTSTPTRTTTPTPTPTPTTTPTPTRTPTPRPGVGGIAEAPDVDASSLEGTASGGPSTSTYAAIGAGVVGAMLLGAAAWYARRRWSS